MRDDIRAACEETLARWLPQPIQFKRQHPRAAGNDLTYRLVGDDLDAAVQVSIRRRLRPAEVALLVEGFDHAGCAHRMLFTDYVTPGLAEKLRDVGIWFADAQGNASILMPERLVVHVLGNRPVTTPTARGQYFSAAGARVLHYLLKQGPHIHATYRDIRAAVEVSIDKIGKLIRELEADGDLRIQGPGNLEIVDGDGLLRRWVEAYGAKLAPTLQLGRFMTAVDLDIGFLMDAATRELADRAVVGGEVAADQLTGHLRPAKLRLYIPADRVADIRRALRLAPSEAGRVELCALYTQAIVNEPAIAGRPTVDAAFAYAELMADGDDRLAETATRIRKAHLAWTL